MRIVAHFEMHVRSGCTSRFTNARYHLAAFHLASLFDEVARVVGVHGGEVTGMFDDDHQAISRRTPSAKLHLALVGGADRSSPTRTDVDTVMIFTIARSEA